MLGRTGAEVEGMEITDGSCMSVALDLTSGKNTLMLGARNYGFENGDIDGYTNIYLNWRMNF